MTRNVALLRGVNVGGRNKLPMKALVEVLDSIGCKNVRTYIQSGNVVFDGAISGEAISDAVARKFKFRPSAFVISATKFLKVMKRCPFQHEADTNPKSVHLLFVSAMPGQEIINALNDLKSPRETLATGENVLYLHSPDGLAASKIAEKADRKLKTGVTARNWNTICALAEMTKDSK